MSSVRQRNLKLDIGLGKVREGLVLMKLGKSHKAQANRYANLGCELLQAGT
jgi:hypothetical protein